MRKRDDKIDRGIYKRETIVSERVDGRVVVANLWQCEMSFCQSETLIALRIISSGV